MAAREQLAEINRRLKDLRPVLAAALEAMDYKAALACQIEIDDLRRQRDTLRPERQHFYLMQRAAASPAAVIMRHSRQSKPVGNLLFLNPMPAPKLGPIVLKKSALAAG
jgi:hypothetical protein